METMSAMPIEDKVVMSLVVVARQGNALRRINRCHHRGPSQVEDFLLNDAGLDKRSGLFEVRTALIGGIKQDVDVYGKAHASPAFSEEGDFLSIAAYKASRSAKLIRAPIVFEFHTAGFVECLDDLRSPIACASKSEIRRPRGLPSFCWIFLSSFKMGSSMLTVVRIVI